MNFKIRNLNYDHHLNFHKVAYSGDLILIDLKTNTPLHYFEFPPMQKSYKFLTATQLSSSLASYVYRIPIDQFQDFKKKMTNIPRGVRIVKVQVINAKNIEDIFFIHELIGARGHSIRAASMTESYGLNKSIIILEFQGSEEQLKKLLLKLENIKSKNGGMIYFPEKENPYLIVLKERNSEHKKGLFSEQAKI